MDKQRPQGQMGKPMVNVNWNKSFSDGGSAVFKNPILSRQAKPESQNSQVLRKELGPVLQQKLKEQFEEELRALSSRGYQSYKAKEVPTHYLARQQPQADTSTLAKLIATKNTGAPAFPSMNSQYELRKFEDYDRNYDGTVYKKGANVGGANLNAAKDLGMQVGTAALGIPYDWPRIAGMGLDAVQSRISALSKPESIMSTQTSPRLEDQSERVPKFSFEEALPEFGSQLMNESLRNAGAMGGQDYPALSFIPSLFIGNSPLNYLIGKAGKGIGKLSDKARGIREGEFTRVDEPLLSDEMKRIYNTQLESR
jgi:hypothetical protein